MDTATIATEAVRTWHANQDAVEAAGLLRLVAEGSTVVEIGCDRGGMLWAYRQAGAGRVIGIDKPAAGWGTGLACDPHGAHMIVADSHDPQAVASLRSLLGGSSVDLLFIDADHTYEGCRHDWLTYAPFVRPGGVVAFHDIYPHQLFAELQVDRLWWEIRRDHPEATYEIVNRRREPRTGMGIGVLICA